MPIRRNVKKMDTQTKPKTQVQIQVQIQFTDDQLRDALRDIFAHYGYDRDIWGDAAKNEIAVLLSQVARKDPPWGGLYVHNFMTGGVQAGRVFKAAIVGLAAMIDGMPLHLVQGKPVQITALGNVRPGSLVYSDSQKCKRLACPVHFIPRVPWQRYCSPECRKRK